MKYFYYYYIKQNLTFRPQNSNEKTIDKTLQTRRKTSLTKRQ